MNGLRWTDALLAFVVCFLLGLALFAFLSRRRKPQEGFDHFRLFDPPPPGRFRLMKVEIPQSGAFRVAPLSDFPSLEEARAEADRQPPGSGGYYLYYSVIDAGGTPVYVREPKAGA